MASEPAPTPQRLRTSAYVRGIAVFVGLAILTVVEFWLAARTGGSAAFLFIIALVKAALIAEFFMHISHLWAEEVHE